MPYGFRHILSSYNSRTYGMLAPKRMAWINSGYRFINFLVVCLPAAIHEVFP